MVQIVNSVGKRKTAVARVVLRPGSGRININNKEIGDYFNNEVAILRIKEPLIISNTLDKYDIKANVNSGGVSSQVDAIRLAIASAIVDITGSEDIKEQFLNYDRSLLVADTRVKEMYKPNDSKARSKRQKSYR